MPVHSPAQSRSASVKRGAMPTSQHLRLRPLAHAIALALTVGANIGPVHAQSAFSSGWFAAKGAAQNAAASAGQMPPGMAGPVTPGALATASPVAQAAAQSVANLAAAAQKLAVMQAQQAAARQGALAAASVPNGLVAGGLQVDTGKTSGWLNAEAPTQSSAAGQTSVVIRQNADKAILNWETFNVGRDTTVQFQQQPDWAVLNRVNDPLARPSQIQGSIKADGTVLLVNRNGIVFSGSSQVNTRNLVAGAVAISDEQFIGNGIYSAAELPSFTDAKGVLKVEAGAQIATAPVSAVTQGGGYVMLLGQTVENAGQITSSRGQTALAAGDSFVIRKGVGTDGNTASTTRGSEIAAQVASADAGQVINKGLIVAAEGDITLTGRDVQQNGVALSTTTLDTRGTIHLLDSASDKLGKVTLGKGSLTAVTVVDDGTSTALDSQRDALIADSATQDGIRANSVAGVFDNLGKMGDRRDQSRIEIVSGGDVNFQDGSLNLATGGQIAVNAARRTFVGNGAQLDVAGATGVQLSMESNNLKINIQGNELRDAPVTRDAGKLNNANVWIDKRQLILVPAGTGGYATDRWYTPGGLLEVSGYLNTQGHRIGEWAAAGGTIMLGGKEVVGQSGATLNLVGGSLDVQTGYINQSSLKGADGKIYNANQAPANVLFSGPYSGFEDTHARWGDSATDVYQNSVIAPTRVLQNGYTVGRDAGKLLLNAPTVVLESDVRAGVVNGTGQVQARPADGIEAYRLGQSVVALPGTIRLGQFAAYGMTDSYGTDVRFGHVAASTGTMQAGDALAADRQNTAWFDTDRLNAQGLGGLDIVSRNAITVAAPLALGTGGSLHLTAPAVDLNADVTVRGGSVVASNSFLPAQDPAKLVPPVPVASINADGAAHTNLGKDAVVDVRGVWTNTALSADQLAGLAYVDGGKVTLDSSQGVATAVGSLIDSSAGGALLANGSVRGGNGGNIALTADNPGILGYGATPQGALALGGALRSYGAKRGGKLTLSTMSLLISDNPADRSAGGDKTVLGGSFFAQGFSAYELTGYRDAGVAAGTRVEVVAPAYQAGAGAPALPSGADPAAAFDLTLADVYTADALHATVTQRPGASLTLASGYGARTTGQISATGAIDVGTGASINVDPGQSITLQGSGQMNIDGALHSAGGAINIISDRGAADASASGTAVTIGEHALLDAAARPFTAKDVNGRSFGVVPAAGSIVIGNHVDPAVTTTAKSLDASGDQRLPTLSGAWVSVSDAAAVVRRGAVLDVSGASALLDSNAGDAASGPGQAHLVASDGGSIQISSSTAVVLDGAMHAASGGAGAAGGSLGVFMETPAYPLGTVKLADNLLVARPLTVGQTSTAASAAGTPPKVGSARVSVDQIDAGGFDSVSLYSRSALVFDGAVDMHLRGALNLYGGGLSNTVANANVNLTAPTVRVDGLAAVNTDLTQYFPAIGSAFSPRASQAQGTLSIGAGVWAADAQNSDGSHGALSPDAGGMLSIYNNTSTGAAATYKGGVALPSTTTDLANVNDYLGYKTLDLRSAGDIRFVGKAGIASGGDVNLTAQQIYPSTGSTGQVSAGAQNPTGARPTNSPLGALTINVFGGAPVAAPQSAFGSLSLLGGTIRQGGILRAPFGTLTLNSGSTLDLLPGSVTSVSGAGMSIPYGGTADGINYLHNGVAVTAPTAPTVNLTGQKINEMAGAVVDMTGGGAITGAAFVSGRGGSTDALNGPLPSVGARGANIDTASSSAVYAIVPGVQPDYAPLDFTDSAAQPALGQRITVPAGVPGLAAGTYTLLPSYYALQKGGFRVQLGAPLTTPGTVGMLPNGSYSAPLTTSVSNTAVAGALPVQGILTSGEVTRSYSSYNEQGYAAFFAAQAAASGAAVPRLPVDAGQLNLTFGVGATGAPLGIAGSILTGAAAGGLPATVAVNASGPGIDVEIVDAAPSAGFNGISLRAADLNATNAGTLLVGIGGVRTDSAGLTSLSFSGPQAKSVTLRSGATLRAGDVLLGAGSGGVTLQSGSSINTIGKTSALRDAASNSLYTIDGRAAVVAVSNGDLRFVPYTGTLSGAGAINIEDKASLFSNGTLAFATSAPISIGQATYGAKYLTLNQANVNIGAPAALATAVVPPGLVLDQQLVDRLFAGDAAAGVPGVQRLSITANQSINFFGTVKLDVAGNLVMNAPAVYGYGNAGDSATLAASTLMLGGAFGTVKAPSTGGIATNPGVYASNGAPGATVNGAGSGQGVLNLNARDIVFGFDDRDRPNNNVSLDRQVLGFSTVNLNASNKISANNSGSLSVYQAQGATADAAATGGALNLNTPMLTGDSGAQMRFQSGGALTVANGGAAGATASAVSGGGASINLAGDSVSIDSTVGLPGGRLAVSARGDVNLGAHSLIDLHGADQMLVDQMTHGIGGDLVIGSAQGAIRQATGGVIDASAKGADAGTVSLSAIASGAGVNAGAGEVSLAGSLRGGGATEAGSGQFTVQARRLDFDDLNKHLNEGKWFGARNIDLREGDIVVGDNLVRAHQVNLAADQGSLTVNGRIDASGAAPGTIRLAAGGNLTVAAGGVLDAHGSTLQTDSYGAPIEAKNRGHIELTVADGPNAGNGGTGRMLLAPGASFDLSTPGATSYGDIELNTRRVGGAAGGDLAIDAAGPLNIKGAADIALNGFWTYNGVADATKLASGNPNALITQAYLDTIHNNDSKPFIAKAQANGALQARIRGLSNYGAAYHLRPGVLIANADPKGELTVLDDVDLSAYRYGSGVNPLRYGSGEPGVLAIRASNGLNVYGSITDGFAKPVDDPSNSLFPYDSGWALLTKNDAGAAAGTSVVGADFTVVRPLTLGAGTTLPTSNSSGQLTSPVVLSFGATLTTTSAAVPISLVAGATAPANVTLGALSAALPTATPALASITSAAGKVLYRRGDLIPAGTQFPIGTVIGSGARLPVALNIGRSLVVPAGTDLSVFTTTGTAALSLAQDVQLRTGDIVPGGSGPKLATISNKPGFGNQTLATYGVDPNSTSSTIVGVATRPVTGPNGAQGKAYALSALLPAGSQSWSLRLVSGADTKGADLRSVSSAADLAARGAEGDLVFNDPHYAVSSAQVRTPSTTDASGFVSQPGKLGQQLFSVVRTGTGYLDMVSGGDISERSLFGIYTAGTQSAPIAGTTAPRGANVFQTGKTGIFATQLGYGWTYPLSGTSITADIAPLNMPNFADGGGDVLMAAGGDIRGATLNGRSSTLSSSNVNNWLWRAGGDDLGQSGAWWINYGNLVSPPSVLVSPPQLTGFQGIGTLGGGNLTVIAGDAIGTQSTNTPVIGTFGAQNQALDLAVASSGRVGPDGKLVQTGGGDLTLRAGNGFNPQGANGFQTATVTLNANGVVTALRGNIDIKAGSIGQSRPVYAADITDIRPNAGLLTAESSSLFGGPTIVPGDGAVKIATRGDLVLTGVGDAGKGSVVSSTAFDYKGPNATAQSAPGGGQTQFTLWTPSTSMQLFSAGGDVAPSIAYLGLTSAPTLVAPNSQMAGLNFPGSLTAVAQNGDLRVALGTQAISNLNLYELAPSPTGQLTLLANGSIFGGGLGFAQSGADPSLLPTPFKPQYTIFNPVARTAGATFTVPTGSSNAVAGARSLIAYGLDTPTGNLHAGDTVPSYVYAATGDIVDLQIGRIINSTIAGVPQTEYLAAEPVRMIAGRDIVASGSPGGQSAGVTGTRLSPNLFMNNSPTDISVVRAGRDILVSSFDIAGPGLLDVQAGRNLNAMNLGTIESLGQLYGVNASNRNGGADISIGAGALGADYATFARLYLDGANQADPAATLDSAQNAGKVVKTYDGELFDWVRTRFGYSGARADALAYFQALPAEQRALFERQVYFAEIKAGGREFNDPASVRFQSYLRARQAIAALFPAKDGQGKAINYEGGVTMYSGPAYLNTASRALPTGTGTSFIADSGVRTDFGGGIQMLVPGGTTVLGSIGAVAPGAQSGVLTQGSGDIAMYSQGSVLLGQSKVFTTFGGNILMWSDQGDINAGRGAKSAVAFAPVRRVYDSVGDVNLSPAVPASGAGIATLNPVPGSPAGDVDLIAPLGTIDAGEAGIRVSGNVNLAALQVVNAANVQAGGSSAGIPVVPTVNVAALTAASAAGASAAQAAAQVAQSDRGAVRQNINSVITVRVLGFGNETLPQDGAGVAAASGNVPLAYDSNSAVQVLGQGALDDSVLSRLTTRERSKLGR